ncbi:hypothetical protein ACROYT_G040975 [Oculina patagonica]
MAKNKAKTPVISQHAMVDGVSVNSVLLAINLVPVKIKDRKLIPSQAKQLIKNYAPTTTTGKLRTSPDDWWFSVIRRVACAIDKNAKKESVRKMFVDHETKKTIHGQVIVPNTSNYTVDYSWFFDQIATVIQKNVKVPEFVDGMMADFSTTTAVQNIVSQITLMNSVQEYFLYSMLGGCGIPAMEMLGTEDDWKKLKSKLKVLRTLFEPIEKDLGQSGGMLWSKCSATCWLHTRASQIGNGGVMLSLTRVRMAQG